MEKAPAAAERFVGHLAPRLAALAPALAAAGALVFCPVGPLAEEASTASEPTPSEVSWRDGLRFNLAVEGTPDVEYADADVSWLRTTGRLSIQGPVSEQWGLGASLSAELLSSSVDADPSFLAPAAGGGEPLRDLFESTFSVGARRMIRERWAFGSDAYVSVKLEPGANLGDSLRGGTVFTLAYRRSDALEVAGGVKLGSRLDRAGLYAWPVLRVEWQITDRIDFEIHNADLRLAYELRDGFELLGFGGARTDRYRLEERETGPLATDSGTLGVRDATVGVGFRWYANEHFRIVGSVGAVVWQRLKVSDADTDEIASRDAHGAAPVVALRIQARF
jgi:Domain of unknown function (DUF6268)